MLYDTRWDQKTPSLDGFIAWLEKQNPHTMYKYTDPSNCVMAQYLKSLGLPYPAYVVSHTEIINILGTDEIVYSFGWLSFGRVLKRAKNFRETGDVRRSWTFKSVFKSFFKTTGNGFVQTA